MEREGAPVDPIGGSSNASRAEIAIPDAPRADEVLIGLVLSAGGRQHARVKKPGA